MNCSSNKASYANHIWDHKDDGRFMGATACIVIPWFVDWMDEEEGRDWRVLARFIHDHLPYSEMVFFVKDAAVNLTWRGDPNDPELDDECPQVAMAGSRHIVMAVGAQALCLQLQEAEGVVDRERRVEEGV